MLGISYKFSKAYCVCLKAHQWVSGQCGGMKSDNQQGSSSPWNNQMSALWVSMATEDPSWSSPSPAPCGTAHLCQVSPCCRNKCSLATLNCSKDSSLWNSTSYFAAAAAKSLQLCPTLCDPLDGSPPESKSLMHLSRNVSLINVINLLFLKIHLNEQRWKAWYLYNSLSFPGLFVLKVSWLIFLPSSRSSNAHLSLVELRLMAYNCFQMPCIFFLSVSSFSPPLTGCECIDNFLSLSVL